ncbi:MAG TPA: alpha/beta hydrolase [Phycisphaerales bacterium]|nr:alpha/beta hydrolase [Phycisphaerales bacterium]
MNRESPARAAGGRSSGRRRALGWTVYLALLAASHLVQSLGIRPDPGSRSIAVEIPRTSDEGALTGPAQHVAIDRWAPAEASADRPSVLLLHGSPGSGSNFARLGPLLAGAGYEALAPDLPGFGGSTEQLPSYSIKAHAYAMHALLDAMGVERAHVVGWSQGGGVALHMAEMAPERVASVTLMASIGAQEAEGSGSYVFEHAKYGAGYLGLVIGGELLPHFGLLGSYADRHAFIRSFWDTDQRPLRALMERLGTPTLILHGRRDFLTPSRGARLSHELIAPSRLVVLDASHFLPFVRPETTAGHLAAFLERHDEAGRPALRQTVDLAVREGGAFTSLDHAMQTAQRAAPWWLVLAVVAAAAFARAELAAAACAVLVAMVWVDAGVALAGLSAGMVSRTGWAWAAGARAARRAPVTTPALRSWARELARGAFGVMVRTRLQPWRRDEAAAAAGSLSAHARGPEPPAGTAEAPLAQGARRPVAGAFGAIAGSVIWAAASLVPAMVAAALLRAAMEPGLLMLAAGLVAAVLVARSMVFACTWTGRQRIKATLTRTLKHEFWPAWAYYTPLAAWLPWLGLRYGGVMTCTCVNPAIGPGGGVVGESKLAILQGLAAGGPGVLRAVEIAPGEPEARLGRLRAAMERGELAADFPVVLKPNAGQRGYAVRIARDEAHALDYLSRMDRTVVAQEYHPGPVEVGCMWVRDPAPGDGRLGRIFSLTSKHLSDIEGDGRRTVEELIYRNRRLRCQADVLLTRLAGERLDVPAKDERVRVVSVGNHCQGAIFRDASEHITPELEAWVDRVAAGFCAGWGGGSSREGMAGTAVPPVDNGLDFGRFDIRAESVEKLRRAEGLAIIELNGTTAESTNIYDPDRSLLWSWGVLLRQWAVLYRLGARRRALGVRPMGPLELRRAWREFDRDRPAMNVAD